MSLKHQNNISEFKVEDDGDDRKKNLAKPKYKYLVMQTDYTSRLLTDKHKHGFKLAMTDFNDDKDKGQRVDLLLVYDTICDIDGKKGLYYDDKNAEIVKAFNSNNEIEDGTVVFYCKDGQELCAWLSFANHVVDQKYCHNSGLIDIEFNGDTLLFFYDTESG